MSHLFIIAIAFLVISYCFSRWIEKKHNIQDKGGQILAIVVVLLTFSFLLGLFLSNSLKG